MTVALSSRLVWDKLRPGGGSVEPILLHFPAYTRAEVRLAEGLPGGAAS